MKYKQGVTTKRYVCAVNSVQHNGEYTLCGNAIPDTTLKNDDCEHIGDSYTGVLNKVTCPDCRLFINFIKNLK
jgi:hypothetical protein